jgi:hypothetical protein
VKPGDQPASVPDQREAAAADLLGYVPVARIPGAGPVEGAIAQDQPLETGLAGDRPLKLQQRRDRPVERRRCVGPRTCLLVL